MSFDPLCGVDVYKRQILDDPALSGIGAVLFDEFHERSLDADLGLALALDCQCGLRDDLRILSLIHIWMSCRRLSRTGLEFLDERTDTTTHWTSGGDGSLDEGG